MLWVKHFDNFVFTHREFTESVVSMITAMKRKVYHNYGQQSKKVEKFTFDPETDTEVIYKSAFNTASAQYWNQMVLQELKNNKDYENKTYHAVDYYTAVDRAMLQHKLGIPVEVEPLRKKVFEQPYCELYTNYNEMAKAISTAYSYLNGA